MSLILAWFTEKFIAAVSDGKAIHKHPDGAVTAAGEHYKKLHLLTPDILLAASGDAELGPWLDRTLAPFVQQNRHDPDLFRCLELAVPFHARHFCASRTYDPPQDHSVLLLGFDGARQRLRGVGWDSVGGFVPVQMGAGNIAIVGHEEGKRLADDRTNGLSANSPEEALSALEGVVKDVGSLEPERVNTNTFSYVVVAPELKEEWHAKGLSQIRVANPASAEEGSSLEIAHADANGNLLLKNIFGGSGTTSSPATTSTTYVIVPEMTKTVTTKGNKVMVIFSGAVTPSNGTQGNVAIFRDGSQITPDFGIQQLNASTVVILFASSLCFIDSPTPGSHTYDVRWKVGNSGAIADGFEYGPHVASCGVGIREG